MRAREANTALFAFAFLSENVEFPSGPYGLERVGFWSLELHGYGAWAQLILLLLRRRRLLIVLGVRSARVRCFGREGVGFWGLVLHGDGVWP